MISVIARTFAVLFALWLLASSLALAQSDCGALMSVPAGATCRDFYRQRESWDQDTIGRCGLTQVDAYKRALGISDQGWGNFLKPCDDSRNPGAAAGPTCTVNVSLTGRYARYADKVGVFESRDGKRGALLSSKAFAIRREGGQQSSHAQLILTPGTYVIFPTCGGRDERGNFGCLVRPATTQVMCAAGRSQALQFTADSAEY
jgi:hypothetical protein